MGRTDRIVNSLPQRRFGGKGIVNGWNTLRVRRVDGGKRHT